jgi:hypothetical protein
MALGNALLGDREREKIETVLLDDVVNLGGLVVAWPIRSKSIWSLPIY